MSIGRCELRPDTITKYRWPLFWPEIFRDELLDELKHTLSTRWIGQGPKVDSFESQFQSMLRTEFLPVAVNSGTSALHLAYILAGVGPGDRVISTVLTCTATNHALLQRGAIISFCDIEKTTLNADPESVISLLKEQPCTKAIVVTHLGGLPCNVDPIVKYCEDNYTEEERPKIICDAAQALGAVHNNYPITSPQGSLGVFASCFSFQAIKHITTADGGALIVSREQDRDRAVRLRWFDIDRNHKARMNWKPWVNRELTIDQYEIGYKYQMTDISACFGLVGLRHLSDILRRRSILASIYQEGLRGIAGLTMLDDAVESSRAKSSNWLFGVRVDRREDFCEAMESRLVETNIVQVRNDVFSVFGGRRRDYLTNMNEVEGEYLYLPFHTQLEVSDVEEICHLIRRGW